MSAFLKMYERMEILERIKKNENILKQAAQSGNINDFYTLIRQDVQLLEHIDELPFADTPLHIAAFAGKIPFAMEMMGLKPSFARKLNQNGFSPIHLALQNGHIELVRRLLQIDGDLVHVKGKERLTPLHHIVESGQHRDLLEEFLLVCPDSIVDVTGRNETALHIALKYNNLEVFKFLVTWLGVNVYKNAKSYQRTVLNWKDDEGNTVLHVAVSKNQSQAVRHLLAWGNDFVDVNHKNLKGKTAWDIVQPQVENGENRDILQGQPQVENRDILRLQIENGENRDILQGQPQVENRDILQLLVENREIRDMLRRAKAKSGSSLSTSNRYAKYQGLPRCCQLLKTDFKREIRKLSEERRSLLLVVAVLLVTVSYQAVLSPPGGLWQDNGLCNTTKVGSSLDGTNTTLPKTKPNFFNPNIDNKTPFNTTAVCEHQAGTAIAFEDILFPVFLVCNTIIFMISNSLIIFLVPNRYMKVLFCALNVTLCLSYSYALIVIAGDPYKAYTAGILTIISALFNVVAQSIVVAQFFS